MSLLRRQLTWGHDTLEQAVADLSPEQRNHQMPGATIQPIATLYAHVVLAEDWLVNDLVRKEPTLFERGGWEAKIGIPPFTASFSTMSPEEWAASTLRCDFDTLREFAQQVYMETDGYLASASESDLRRTVRFGSLGDLPVTEFLGVIVANHVMQHAGEICALKGALGMKGLPY